MIKVDDYLKELVATAALSADELAKVRKLIGGASEWVLEEFAAHTLRWALAENKDKKTGDAFPDRFSNTRVLLTANTVQLYSAPA